MRNKVYLLYTGGWDSTFRLLQLAKEDITVQPIYIIDETRASREYEKKAMGDILKEIRTRDCFRADVKDILYYKVSWIMENCRDDNISRSFNYLRENYHLGTQYEWFALLAKKECLKLECAVIAADQSAIENTIKKETEIEYIHNDFLTGRKQVLPKGDNNIGFDVFGNIIFPVMGLTKQEEGRLAEEEGWTDIMKKTWFCHTPINGKPCGVCHPCRDVMEMGLEWRLPTEAQWRYRNRDKLSFKVLNKIIWRL